MAVNAIITVGELKLAAFREFDDQYDDLLTATIASATADIERQCAPRRFVETTYTAENYSGLLAVGRLRSKLYLDHWPITAVTSIVENGVTLVSGTGYDPNGTLDVLVDASEGLLHRVPGPNPPGRTNAWRAVMTSHEQEWAEGYQNIAITYKAGYIAADIPEDIKQVCIELSIMMFNESRQTGVVSSSRSSGSLTRMQELSPMSQRILKRYIAFGRPRCR